MRAAALVLSFGAFFMASGEACAEEEQLPQSQQQQQQHTLGSSSDVSMALPAGRPSTEPPTATLPAQTLRLAKLSPPSGTSPAEMLHPTEAPTPRSGPPTKERPSPTETSPDQQASTAQRGAEQAYLEHEPISEPAYRYEYDARGVAAEPMSDEAPVNDRGNYYSGSVPASEAGSAPAAGDPAAAPNGLPTREPVVFEESKPLPTPSSLEEVLTAPLVGGRVAHVTLVPRPSHYSGAPESASALLGRSVSGLDLLSSLRSRVSSAAYALQNAGANTVNSLTDWTPTIGFSSTKGIETPSKDPSSPTTPTPPLTPLVPLGADSAFFTSSGSGQPGGGDGSGASSLLLLLLGILASGLILLRPNGKLFEVFCEVPKMSSALLSPLERPG